MWVIISENHEIRTPSLDNQYLMDFPSWKLAHLLHESYTCLEAETSTLKWLFQLDDSKSLHEKNGCLEFQVDLPSV